MEMVSGVGVGQTWPVLFFRYGFSDFHSRITAWTTFSSPCKERSSVAIYPSHINLRQCLTPENAGPAHWNIFTCFCTLTWSRSVSCSCSTLVCSRSWLMVS